MFDIAKVDLVGKCEKGIWHDVKLPNGEKAGFCWKLRGFHSRMVSSVYLDNMGITPKANSEQTKKLAVEIVSAATIEIENLTANGVPITGPNQKQKIEEILTKNYEWLTTQLLEIINDQMLFF